LCPIFDEGFYPFKAYIVYLERRTEMKKLAKNISLFLALTLAASISLLSCGGGGMGMGVDSGGQMSTIRGNVTDVMAMAPMGGMSSMVAQGSGVAEITVEAQQGGMTIDTDVTDQEGNFTLTVSPGNVTLIFTTAMLPNPVSTMVEVPENSMVDVAIAIQPTQVVVQQMQVTQNTMP
jgi:hypothetical protein